MKKLLIAGLVITQLSVYAQANKKVETKVTSTSSDNNDYKDLDNIESAVYAKMTADDKMFMQGKMSPQNTPDYAAKTEGFRERFRALNVEAYVQFIKTHPNSALSLKLFPKVAYDQPFDLVKPLFDGLSPAIKSSIEGKKIAESLYNTTVAAIGRPAPDFEIADTQGKMVKLSSLKGKYVLLDFWASWCGPCRAENPNLIKVYNSFKDRNFTVVGVALDKEENRAAWLAAIKSDGLPWLQLSELNFWDSKAAKTYGVQAIPQNFLIDPNGIIIGKTLMGKDLAAKLSDIFNGKSKDD